MKLTTILLLVAVFQVSAKGSAQTVTYSAKNEPLTRVFAEIKKQTGYALLFRKQDLKHTTPITVSFKKVELETALQMLLKDQQLEFEIEENTIFIRPKIVELHPRITDLLSGAPPVTGIIRGPDGQPLAGVSIVIKGTTRGTVTDAYGKFTIEADPGDILIVSSVEYETREVKISGENININLVKKVSEMDIIVINKGYYTEKQRFSTGSVSKVSGETISKQPVSNPILALQGRVPGLDITQSNGVPGSNVTVRIRGRNSIGAGNDPLYIVDGVPFPSTSLTQQYTGGLAGPLSPLNTLNPAEIESIEVLKDADATSIYGSRGANGVILITTKKGKPGQSKIDVNVSAGATNVTRMYDMMNTRQYLDMRYETFANDSVDWRADNIRANDLKFWDTTRSTDWQKMFIGGTGNWLNAQASVSGGNETTQFLISGGFNKETAIFPGDYSDTKASGRLSITHSSLNKKFRASVNASYLVNNNKNPTSTLWLGIFLPPHAPDIYDESGNLNWENGTFDNPMAPSLTKVNAKTGNLATSINLSLEILPGLSLSANGGYTTIIMDQSNITPLASYPPSLASLTNFRTHATINNKNNTWILEPQINFRKRVGGGSLDALAGITAQENFKITNGQSASDFASDILLQNILNGKNKFFIYDYKQYRQFSAYGRIAYTWRDKYFINLTGRRDGSTRFADGLKFGNFGAVGAGWIFTEEPFVKRALPFLSFGKIKSDYGTSGNDQIGDYGYFSTYTTLTELYFGNTTLLPSRIANPYFSWEQLKKFGAGIELGFANDKVRLNAAYYKNRTTNQLVGYALSGVTGFQNISANLPAVIQNSGWEMELSTTNVATKWFSWKTTALLTIPRNKLVAFPNIEASSYSTIYEVGKSLYHQKRYRFLGIDQTTGIYTFEDVNKDGRISNPDDLQDLKQINKPYYGSLLNSLSHKGFQLDFLAVFVKQTAEEVHAFGYPGFSDVNQPLTVLDRWRKPGDQALIQRLTRNYSSPAGTALQLDEFYGDRKIGDASFIRIKNVSLSYTLPDKVSRAMRLQNLRIYAQCQNLLTFSNYKGLDPETGGTNSLPPMRTITAGINLIL